MYMPKKEIRDDSDSKRWCSSSNGWWDGIDFSHFYFSSIVSFFFFWFGFSSFILYVVMKRKDGVISGFLRDERIWNIKKIYS